MYLKPQPDWSTGLMTPTAVAALLGVALADVEAWVKARRWPDGEVMQALGVAGGDVGRVRITRADFEAYQARAAK